MAQKCLANLFSFVLYSSRPPFRQPEGYMAQVFVRVVAIFLALGCTVCVKSFAQSIGPDGRVLPIYSGGHAATPPTVTPPPSAPATSSGIAVVNGPGATIN